MAGERFSGFTWIPFSSCSSQRVSQWQGNPSALGWGAEASPPVGVTPSAPSFPGHSTAGSGTLLSEVDLHPVSFSHLNPKLLGAGMDSFSPSAAPKSHRRVCCILFCKLQVTFRPGSEPCSPQMQGRGKVHVFVAVMFNLGLPFPSTTRLAKRFWCRQTIASWHRSSHRHPTCPGYLLNESSYLGQLESGCECGSDVNRYYFFPPP